MLVTGLSGAGKTTALKTLEDMGWEAIDNFPIRLLARLIDTPQPLGREDSEQPMAIGFDCRTRGFDPDEIIRRIKKMQKDGRYAITMLFLDCAGAELERRYNETRRKHPLALDRPASAGIAEERGRLQPLRRWAENVIDTTPLSSNDLQKLIRERFGHDQASRTTITLTSFGFARGMPPSADLVFDMRFLRNPHWDDRLRPMTGLDDAVGAFVHEDPAYEGGIERIASLLEFLLPRYQAAGKAYVNIAIGCTGGRHRSVYVTEQLSKRLHDAGFCPTVEHRNLTSRPVDAFEGQPGRAPAGRNNQDQDIS
ncbi:MAG: RNase adapter RapZ [Blastomonas sp.]